MAKESKRKKTIGVSAKKRSHLRTQAARNDETFFARLQKIEIFDEVVGMIRQGYPLTDVAKYIQKLGFLEDMTYQQVHSVLGRLVREKLSPTDLASVRFPKVVANAAKRVKEGMDQLDIIERATMAKWEEAQRLRKLVDIIMKDDDQVEDPDERMIAAQRFEILGGMPALVKLLIEVRKGAVSHAEVQDMLGLSGPGRADSVAEINARVSEYAQMTFPGDERTHKAFSNPSSRRKLLGILRKVAKQRSLYEGDEEAVDEELAQGEE